MGRPARGFWGCQIASLGILIVGIAGGGPSLAQAPASPYKPVFALSTAVGPAYPWGKGADDWARLVKERTAGRIVIRQFPGASATGGDPSREFAALRAGMIDLAVGSAMNWSAEVKALNLFALPFMIGDVKALDAVLRGDVGATLLRAVEEAGVVPLAWGDNEFREVSTTERAVKKPADVAGLRLRVTGSALVEEMLRALGATTARMKWPDAQNALLGGTVDGQETAPQSFVATKAHTLNQTRLTLWALAADPLLFAVSRAAWEGWSPADREIVKQAAVEAARREVDASRAATQAAVASLGREYKAAGVEVIRLSAEERAAFVGATKGVFDKWSGEIGPDLVRRAQEAIEAAKKP